MLACFHLIAHILLIYSTVLPHKKKKRKEKGDKGETRRDAETFISQFLIPCKSLMCQNFSKACLFAWAATKGKIPMEDLIKRMNFHDPSKCSSV